MCNVELVQNINSRYKVWYNKLRSFDRALYQWDALQKRNEEGDSGLWGNSVSALSASMWEELGLGS